MLINRSSSSSKRPMVYGLRDLESVAGGGVLADAKSKVLAKIELAGETKKTSRITMTRISVETLYCDTLFLSFEWLNT